jgi:hypothetical protein
VSDDGNLEAFQRNYALMPWLALPYPSDNVKLELKKYACINGIPHLLVLSGIDGTILCEDASDLIQ